MVDTLTTKPTMDTYFEMISGQGLKITSRPTKEAYLEMAYFLRNVRHTTRLAWGYLLVSIPKKYGDTYNQVAAISGYSPSTLANLKSIANRIPVERVPPGLTDGHLIAVCDQRVPREVEDELLQACADSAHSDEGLWTPARFRREIRERLGLPDTQRSSSTQDTMEENYELNLKLAEASRVILQATQLVEQMATVIDDAPLGPEAEELTTKAQEFVNEPYPMPVEIVGKWEFKQSVKGGVVPVFVEETAIGKVKHASDMGLPDAAMRDLEMRLGVNNA